VQRAIGGYVRARGGAEGIARRLSLASDVGARLYEALDRIARDGFDAALAALGIELNDRSVSAIADALMSLVCDAGAGALDGILDVSMARAACDETFIALYERGASLTALTVESVPGVIQSFAVNAACLLITRDIATTIVDNPRTETESRDLQSTLKAVVESSMQLNLPSRTSAGYTIRDIRHAITTSYQDAFQILLAGR